MHPIIARLGPITIYSYGFMLALGFIVGSLLAARQAARFNISQDKIINLSLVILISGVIGARVLYVLLNLKDYVLNPLEIIMVTRGGLVFYGGAIFAFLASLIYMKRAGMSVLDTADLVSPYIALGHSIGRLGCLLNGCCFGKPTSSQFGIVFQDGIVRIPTQVYSSLSLLFLYMFLRVCLRCRAFKGQVLFLYLIFYSTGRVFMENFRGDSPPVIFGLTFSQIVSIAIFVIGVAGYFYGAGQARHKGGQVRH